MDVMFTRKFFQGYIDCNCFFLPNLSLHVTNFKTFTPLDSFLIKQAAFTTDFAINSGNVLLSR